MITQGILLLLCVVILACARLSLWVWLAGILAWLSMNHWLGHLSTHGWLITSVISVLIMSVLLVPCLRKRLVTSLCIMRFRKTLPTISETERAALDAGHVWWEGELFKGLPNWKKLRDMPKSVLTEEETKFLNTQVKTLCQMLDHWQIEQDADLPVKVWDYIKKEHFWGMIIPKVYGGLEFSALAHSTVIMSIATRHMGTAVTVMVPNSLGPAELLLRYGTQEQKEYYLPRLAQGTEIPCFGLTGPEAGSDAGAMTDTGVVCYGEHEGKKVLGLRLNWDKRYITLAPIATVLGLAFKLYDPDCLLSQESNRGITLCLIPSKHPGVEIGARHSPSHCAFMNGPTRGHDVFIPLDWIIGGPDYIGEGWRMLMECLAAGRGISLPALSTAYAKHVYRITGAYARIREQFNVPIGYFEGVQEALARIVGNTYLLDATRQMTACAVDQGIHPSIPSAIAKYHMTELARVMINDAMDIHGGRGIMCGPRNYLSEHYQGTPIAITVEGADILTRSLMIFGQGAVRCHPYVLKEIAALSDDDRERGLKTFDKLLFTHAGYTISNAFRTVMLGLTGGRYHLWAPRRNADIAYFYRQLGRMSTAFALVTDVAMLLFGGSLKRKESLSARLGDVLSELYLASAVLRYYEHNGGLLPDVPVVSWCLHQRLYRIQQAFIGLFENMPQRAVACLLKRMVFPWGARFRLPSDALTQEVARMSMDLNQFRERMVQYGFINEVSDDPTGRVEMAYKAVLAAEPAHQKVQAAIKRKQLGKMQTLPQQWIAAVTLGIITQAEADMLLTAQQARYNAILVDEFSADQMGHK